GYFGGWLGRTYDPLFVRDDPGAPEFAMPELTPPAGATPTRLAERNALLRTLGAIPPHLAPDRGLPGMDRFQAKAFQIPTSLETLPSRANQRAFRIDQDAARTRERYGRNVHGQSVLLARRLIEAGTRVACVSWTSDILANWDTHRDNFARLKDTLLPTLDAAL